MIATAKPLGGPSPAAAQTVLWVFVAALLADRAIGGRTPWQPSGTNRGTFWRIQAGQLLALVLGLFAPQWIPATNLHAWIWPVGAAAMVLGAVLRVWSLRALGHGFSRDVQVTQDQQLVAIGGGTKGGLWTQIVSDVTGITRSRPTSGSARATATACPRSGLTQGTIRPATASAAGVLITEATIMVPSAFGTTGASTAP